MLPTLLTLRDFDLNFVMDLVNDIKRARKFYD